MSGISFDAIPLAPVDPILGLNAAFAADKDAKKVNVGVGAYRDDAGLPYVLPSVRKAEKLILDAKLNKEYLPITGLASYVDKALGFAYGKEYIAANRQLVAGVQSLSGTGACRIAGEFVKTFSLAENDTVYLPDPTWGNHFKIFQKAGLKTDTYPYYDTSTNGLDFAGYLAKVKSVADGSFFLVHACAHNPTGMDPTKEQWEALSQAMKAKNHLVLMDCAYQGFASGNAEDDAFAIRLFVSDGNRVCLAQSFAKNFGLYSERVGTFSVICSSEDEKVRVESQLKLVIRPMYSNPPVNGARIVDTVLGDVSLEAEWRNDCKQMAERIHDMRSSLRNELKLAGSVIDWSHIEKQIGMFCYTGLDKNQVEQMRTQYHVYMTSNGRISMAGVNSGNVRYMAEALHEVSKNKNKL